MKSSCKMFLALVSFVVVGQSGSAQSVARTDVYHVYFAKAALGKGAEEGDYLKQQDPKAPMPGHFLVLRHQSGEDWTTRPSSISEPRPRWMPRATRRPPAREI